MGNTHKNCTNAPRVGILSLLYCGIYVLSVLIIGLMPARADDIFIPREHFKLEQPTLLKPADATKIYESIIEEMADGYSQSGNEYAMEYGNWQRENNAPYLSAGHGNRYLNNFSNKIAENYLNLRRGEKMPIGSVLAKDSFTVTKDNDIFAGALFIMEKLAAGTKVDHGDWRYLMIMPDGSLLGDSTVAGDESMNFCHDCHIRVKNRDYLFLIPKPFRRTSQN